jgi:tRNA U34 2-thiouridine synthase MnmA/TrmU
MNQVKALALYSGGLDSLVACRVIMEQGIVVTAIHFITPFFGYDKKGREKEVEAHALKYYGITLKIVDVSHDFLTIVKNPRHGYGKNLNPCVDCKIFLFSKARDYLKGEGASFLITGEVLGQRPMSQRRDTLRIIERDSGTEGILLRPLCAKRLKPTIPEERGWVDRNKLLDLAGRGRTPQMALAKHFGITHYATPAGGCLLTNKHTVARIQWFFDNTAKATVNDMLLATVGRHFALDHKTLLVVGRSEKENLQISQLAQPGDVKLELAYNPGPVSLLRGPCTPDIVKRAASITVRYSKVRKKNQVTVVLRREGTFSTEELTVHSIPDQLIEDCRIV